jgi:hypothetical protein
VPQGDFDGVIEAYRHALDAFLKLMIKWRLARQTASSAV